MLRISWTELVTNVEIIMKPGIKKKLNKKKNYYVMIISSNKTDFIVKYQKALLTVKRYRKTESHVDRQMQGMDRARAAHHMQVWRSNMADLPR